MRFMIDIEQIEDVKDNLWDSDVWFFAIKKLLDCETFTGRFFCIFFLWPVMLFELCLGLAILAFIIVLGIPLSIIVYSIPILNLCILKDSIDEDRTFDKICSIIGIIIDIIGAIFLLIRFLILKKF